MATEINRTGRIIHKHDTEENWLKAVNFIPKQAEIIIYDKDSSHDYSRFKIGDGVNYINDLPFATDGRDCMSELLAVIAVTGAYNYIGIWDSTKESAPKAGDSSWFGYIEGSSAVSFINDCDIINVGTEQHPSYLISLSGVYYEFANELTEYEVDTTNASTLRGTLDKLKSDVNTNTQDISQVSSDVEELRQSIGNKKIVSLKGYDSLSGAYGGPMYITVTDSLENSKVNIQATTGSTDNDKIFLFSKNLIKSFTLTQTDSSGCSYELNSDKTITLTGAHPINPNKTLLLNYKIDELVDDIDLTKKVSFVIIAKDINADYPSIQSIKYSINISNDGLDSVFNAQNVQCNNVLKSDLALKESVVNYNAVNLEANLGTLNHSCTLYVALVYTDELKEFNHSNGLVDITTDAFAPEMVVVESGLIRSLSVEYACKPATASEVVFKTHEVVIDNRSSHYYIDSSLSPTISISPDLSLGEVKYITISGLGNTAHMIDLSNFNPTSLNGFTRNDIENTAGSATMMVIRDNIDDKLANWYLFSTLPAAEDYSF